MVKELIFTISLHFHDYDQHQVYFDTKIILSIISLQSGILF